MNVVQKFREKAPSILEQIQMKKVEAERRQKAKDDETRSKNKSKNQLKYKDVLKGNIPDEIQKEISLLEK